MLLKRYAFDIRKVNSADMRDSFLPGDAVLVKKYGNDYITGDILFFEHFISDTVLSRPRFIQRLIGMPGDTLEIRTKAIYLNGMRIEDTATVKHNYFITTKKYKPDSAFNSWYRLEEGGAVSDAFDYSYSLTEYDRHRLGRDTAVKSMAAKSEKPGASDPLCYPRDARYKWNRDHFGPFYVPAAGDTIALDSMNFALYGAIIRTHEKNNAERRGDSVFINGRHAPYYVIKKNYFFLLGDNRDNADDSRTFGPVPENRIFGKVVKLLRRPAP